MGREKRSTEATHEQIIGYTNHKERAGIQRFESGVSILHVLRTRSQVKDPSRKARAGVRGVVPASTTIQSSPSCPSTLGLENACRPFPLSVALRSACTTKPPSVADVHAAHDAPMDMCPMSLSTHVPLLPQGTIAQRKIPIRGLNCEALWLVMVAEPAAIEAGQSKGGEYLKLHSVCSCEHMAVGPPRGYHDEVGQHASATNVYHNYVVCLCILENSSNLRSNRNPTP